MMTAQALAALIRCAEDAGIAVISDEIYHGLDYAFPAESAARCRRRRHRHQFVLQIFLHDRLAHRLDGGAAGAGAPVERLQQNLAISVPTLSQIAAEAAFDGERRTGGGQARLRGEPPHPGRGSAARRARLLPAGRRRVLSLCRRFAILRRQFRFRAGAAGRGRRRGDAGRRFRSASTGTISCGCAMRARPPTCAKRSNGSARGSGG